MFPTEHDSAAGQDQLLLRRTDDRFLRGRRGELQGLSHLRRLREQVQLPVPGRDCVSAGRVDLRSRALGRLQGYRVLEATSREREERESWHHYAVELRDFEPGQQSALLLQVVPSDTTAEQVGGQQQAWIRVQRQRIPPGSGRTGDAEVTAAAARRIGSI